MRVLAISGSLRSGSYNTQLLDLAGRLSAPDVQLELYDELAELPHYNMELDTENVLEPVARLRDAIDSADAVLIATPEFNGTMPGSLKDALDWASRPYPENALRGKPVAVIGASAGNRGAIRAQADARKVLGVIGANVLDAELPIGGAWAAFTDDGQLADSKQRGHSWASSTS
jgi:chromate reductase